MSSHSSSSSTDEYCMNGGGVDSDSELFADGYMPFTMFLNTFGATSHMPLSDVDTDSDDDSESDDAIIECDDDSNSDSKYSLITDSSVEVDDTVKVPATEKKPSPKSHAPNKFLSQPGEVLIGRVADVNRTMTRFLDAVDKLLQTSRLFNKEMSGIISDLSQEKYMCTVPEDDISPTPPGHVGVIDPYDKPSNLFHIPNVGLNMSMQHQLGTEMCYFRIAHMQQNQMALEAELHHLRDKVSNLIVNNEKTLRDISWDHQ